MQTVKFSDKIKALSDFELYQLAKQLLIEEHIGLLKSPRKCDLVFDEAERRNKKIFYYAMIDAIVIITNLEENMNGLRISNIKRIDFMTKAELVNFLQTIGASSKHPVVDDSPATTVDLLTALGIDQKNAFICKVSGESMKEANIYEGDTLIVEQSEKAKDGDIIVASILGELVVKRLHFENGNIWLHSENRKFPPFKISDELNFKIFGIVKHVLHSFK